MGELNLTVIIASLKVKMHYLKITSGNHLRHTGKGGKIGKKNQNPDEPHTAITIAESNIFGETLISKTENEDPVHFPSLITVQAQQPIILSDKAQNDPPNVISDQ